MPLNSIEREMVAKLICELEYLHETHDVHDSIRNNPDLAQAARTLFGIPDEDSNEEDEPKPPSPPSP